MHATRTALEQLGVKVRENDGVCTIVSAAELAALRGARRGDSTAATRGRRCAILAGILAGRPFLTILTGDASLRDRPMARVVEPLRAMGATIDGRADGTRAPLVIRGGALRGMRHELAVASAQVKSAICLAGLQADGTTEVVLAGADA